MNLIQLLRLEWFKFWRNKLIKFGLLFLLILPPGLLFMVSRIKTQPPAPDGISYVSFPEVWNWAAYMFNWSSFFMLGFIALYIITYERENRLLKQSILNGQKRLDYFIGKLSFIGVISLGYALYYILVSLLFGLSFTEGDMGITFDWQQIFGVLLMFISYSSLGVLFAMVFRKVGIASILYFIYGMFLENIIRYAIHGNVVFNKSMNFYPVNAAEDLAPVPMPESMGPMVEASQEADFSIFLAFPEAAITSGIYILLFLGLSYYLMMYRDL